MTVKFYVAVSANLLLELSGFTFLSLKANFPAALHVMVYCQFRNNYIIEVPREDLFSQQ